MPVSGCFCSAATGQTETQAGSMQCRQWYLRKENPVAAEWAGRVSPSPRYALITHRVCEESPSGAS